MDNPTEPSADLKLTARDLKLTGPRPGTRDSTDPHRLGGPADLNRDYYETIMRLNIRLL